MKKNIFVIKEKIGSNFKFISIKGGNKEIKPDLSVNDWACTNVKDCSTSTNLQSCTNSKICRS